MFINEKIAKVFYLFLVFSFFLSLQSCGSEDKADAKSIEEIRAEEGIPVKIDTIEYKTFEKTYSFFARLSGIKEATKGAAIGGKIEKINANIGDNVSKDQVIVQMEEDNPGLQYEQAKTAYENAEKNYQRMKTLLEAGETSQANFDGAETNYLVSKRNFEAQKQLLFIESPFNGTVVDIKVNEGDNVQGDSHLFTVAQLDKMKAKIWVNDEEVLQIKKGMDAFVECGGKSHPGKVTSVSMVSDPYKQAFAVEVEFNNAKRELLCGVTSDIKISVYKNEKAVVVPRNLLRTDEKGSYVFTEENETAVKKYIKNGNGSGIDYEIKQGLQPGDKLITQGTALLSEGKKVKVIQ